jgi:DNA-binding transcriptional regulator YdaS (Cro superfamily)
VRDDIKSGDLAAAERCVFECEKFKGSRLISFSQEGVNKRVNRQHCLAAKRIISAYENATKLNVRQKEALKIAQGIPPSKDCI